MRRAILVGVLLISTAAGRLIAGQDSGNVYGHVADETGAGLPGATATLTGPTIRPLITTTDARGDFRFLGLAPASYTATLELPGFTKVVQQRVVVTLGKNTEFTVTMKVSPMQETMTVSAATPLIDTRKTETGATFAQEELQQVPTARDVWVVMQQVPGVQVNRVNVGGNQSGSQADFVGKGSYQSTYIYDGVNVTDNGSNGTSAQYFDFDAFQEVQIATGGSDLSLNTGGVTINMITKRGTNQWKGSGRSFYAPSQFQSDNTPDEIKAIPNFQTNKTRFIRENGAEFGGPLLKDRAWLWVGASRQDINLDQTGQTDFQGNPLVSLTTLENWNAKLNLQLTGNNSAEFLYNRNEKLVNGRGASTTRPQETAWNQSGPTTVLKLQDSHVFSPNLIATAFFGYVDEPYRLIPVGGLDKQVYFDNGGSVAHNSYRYSIINSPQHHANVQASTFFNTGSIGHELKFGFQYRHSVTQSESAWPGDQIFGSDTASITSPHCGKNADSCYAALTRGAATSFKMNYTEGWVGDTLTADRLTVNAGLRFDYQQGANLPSKVGANPDFPTLLPAVNYAGDTGYPITYRNYNPRVGVTYSLDSKRKTLVRASYSRFVDQLRNVVYHINGLPVISGVYYYWNDANNDKIVQPSEVDLESGSQGFYHIDPSYAPGTPNKIAPNYKAPTTDELIIGFDHELMTDFAVSAAYTYRYITNIQRSPLVGVTASDYVAGGFASGTAVGTNGFRLNFSEPFYKLSTPSAPPGNIYENQPGAYQRYNGVEVQLIKRLSNNWMMRASFGYNDWRQYLSAESIVNRNNLLGGTNDSGGLAVASDSSNPGYDAKWQFNLTGLYQLPLGLNVGANFLARQGYSIPYYVRVRARDAFGSSNRYSIQIGRVDDYRLDNVYELDMRLEKAFPIGPVQVTGSVDVFNVTNSSAVTYRDNRVGDFDARGSVFTPNPTFNQPTQVQSPRIVRIGARIAF
ncbi:MAG: carboxypeptidase regulatory-like domain-containing protein [Thermoanaerobaculia bacterium]